MNKTERQLADEIIAIARRIQPKFTISNGKLTDSNGTFSLTMYPSNVVRESIISYK